LLIVLANPLARQSGGNSPTLCEIRPVCEVLKQINWKNPILKRLSEGMTTKAILLYFREIQSAA